MPTNDVAPEQLAAVCGITAEVVRRAIRSGRLAARTDGSRYFILFDHAVEYATRRGVPRGLARARLARDLTPDEAQRVRSLLPILERLADGADA